LLAGVLENTEIPVLFGFLESRDGELYAVEQGAWARCDAAAYANRNSSGALPDSRSHDSLDAVDEFEGSP